MHYNYFKARMTMGAKLAQMVILAFAFIACSGGGDKVSIEGRLLSMNQADFLLYSPDGAISGIDTLHVQGGRFEYEKEIEAPGTIVIVFPNFMQLPIFVEPGASISIKGNAAHISETKISGTEDNELFSQWRMENAKAPEKEALAHAEQFIKLHPTSLASLWLIRQYLILSANPNIEKARQLFAPSMKVDKPSMPFIRMKAMLDKGGTLKKGTPLPSFTAKDVNGRTITSDELKKGTAVIVAFASWSPEGQNILRQLASNQRFGNDSTRIDHILAISIDPDTATCMRTIRSCKAENITVVCDGKLTESPLLKTLGIGSIPDDIKLKDGKVTERSLSANALIAR